MTPTMQRQLRGFQRQLDDLRYERNGEIIVPKSGSETIAEFGIKEISGATVTIFGGSIYVGETEVTAGDTPLTLNTDSFVGWEYSFGGGLVIKSFGSTFAQDSGYIRRKLYFFSYTAPVAPAEIGSIALVRGCPFAEVYPANWGRY